MERLLEMLGVMYAAYALSVKNWNYTSEAAREKRKTELKKEGLTNTFYFIHARTLFVLTVVSGGAFTLYWLLQQWHAVLRGFRRADGTSLKGKPFVRTLGGAFTFLGFLPRKAGKAAKMISAAYGLKIPVVLYESPYRVIKMLELIAKTLGENTPVILARELSKVYEEWLRGTAKTLAEELSKKSKVQGEFVMIIDRPSAPEREKENEPDTYF